MGGAFAASVKPLIQHGRASGRYFEERHSWRSRHIYKQIWRPLVEEILTLEREEGNNHDKFAISLKYATVLGHVPREFSWVF